MIDWPDLLDAYHIEYVESGKSTSKGNIYVRCPWCGPADQGHHLGIHLGKGRQWKGYGCWKASEHRGASPRRLLAALLGIGLSQAQGILETRGGGSLGGAGAMQERVKAMKGEVNVVTDGYDTKKLRFPPEVRPLEGSGQSKMFIDYLVNERGYTKKEAIELSFRYKLRYAMDGDFAYRIVIPVYDRRNKLVTMVGRTIADKDPKYWVLPFQPNEPGKLSAKGPITDYLYNEYELRGRLEDHALVVCEGPMDAIRVDYFCGPVLDVSATCLFGKVITPQQLDRLALLSEEIEYDTRVLILDRDAEMHAHKLQSKLRPFGFKVAKLPPGPFKDLGEMPKDKLLNFIDEICS